MACALDIVGDRWTLLVIRDMVMGSKRYFQDFLESDEKIASNILAFQQFQSAGELTAESVGQLTKLAEELRASVAGFKLA